MKSLVIYFSAEFGSTKKIAGQLAVSASADLFEIRPEKPYTEAGSFPVRSAAAGSLRKNRRSRFRIRFISGSGWRTLADSH